MVERGREGQREGEKETESESERGRVEPTTYPLQFEPRVARVSGP